MTETARSGKWPPFYREPHKGSYPMGVRHRNEREVSLHLTLPRISKEPASAIITTETPGSSRSHGEISGQEGIRHSTVIRLCLDQAGLGGTTLGQTCTLVILVFKAVQGHQS